MIMTSSFSQVLLSIKNEISLAGMVGIQYKSLVERHSLTQKLGYFIAIQIIAHHTHLIKHGDNVLDSNSFLFGQYLEYYEKLCCFANVGEIERAFHMTVPGALDEDNGHLGQILETVSKSQEKGCLVSDLTKNESGAQNHTYVDKLIGLGCLVKQGINPLISSESRTESKSVVVHNKLYAPHYNNLADGVKLVVGNGQLDRIHDLIIDILDKRNVQVLPARDLARQMGMSRWDMQALRNASLAQDKKEPAKVKFFQMICNSRLKNGTLSSALLMWCVSKASDLGYYDSSTGKYAFTSPRNFSVYETVAASLAEVDTGLTANDIRVRTGAPYKKAAKIFVSFHKNFGFPLEKFQDGKQLKHRILPKQCASEGFRKLSLPSNRLFSDQQLLNTETIVEFLQKVMFEFKILTYSVLFLTL